MTYESSTGASRSTGKTVAVAVLVIIAILAIVAGAMYLAEPAKSLPSVLGTITSPASRANEHRSLRGWIAIVIAVVLLVAAWFTARMGRTAKR
jgi:amino acid permease